MRAALFMTYALAVASPVLATDFTAGPSGTYPTVQAAVTAAIAAGGDNQVKVQAGVHAENVLVSAAMTAGDRLQLSGGWNEAFSQRVEDRSLTVLSGGGSGITLQLWVDGGETIVENLTVTAGNSTAGGQGAGVFVLASSDAVVRLSRLRVSGNSQTPVGAAGGGGMSASLSGTSRLELVDSLVDLNLAESSTSSSGGGGVDLYLDDSATALLARNEIRENTARSAGGAEARGGGVLIGVYGASSVELLDNLVVGNILDGDGPAEGSGMHLSAGGLPDATSSSVTARRNRVLDNVSQQASPGFYDYQVNLGTVGEGMTTFTDSTVAGGDGGGVYVPTYDDAVVNLTNLSVADNAGDGLAVFGWGSGTVSLANTIAYGNGSDLVTGGTLLTSANLVGTDPSFAASASGNVGLMPGSAALEQGDDAPLGGLGPMDLVWCPRVVGASVDQGAHEGTSIFCSGADVGSLVRWSGAQP